MDNLRFRALDHAMSRSSREVVFPDKKVSEYFGELTFNRVP